MLKHIGLRLASAAVLLALLCAWIPALSGYANTASAAPASLTSAASTYLTIAPQEVNATPQSIIVAGCGFIPGELVNVQLLNPDTLAPVAGTLQQILAQSNGCLASVNNNYTVPSPVASGSYIVRAQGGSETLFGFLAVGVQVLGINPSAFNYSSSGTNVNVSGGGFVGDTSVTFSLRSTLSPNNVLADSSEVVPIPGPNFYNLTYVVQPNATPGTYFLYAIGNTSGVHNIGLITILGGTPTPAPPPSTGGLLFYPNPVNSGFTETVTACNLSTTSGLTVSFDYYPSGTVYFGSLGISSIVPTSTAGCYNISFLVPNVPAGTYTVVVSNGITTDAGQLQVNVGTGSTGTLTLTPNPAYSGDLISATGCGFVSTDILTLRLYSNLLNVATPALQGTAFVGFGSDGSKCYKVTFYLPYLGPQAYTVQLSGSVSGTVDTGTLNVNGNTGYVPAPMPYPHPPVIVPPYTLIPSTLTVSVGQTITLNANGFSVGTTITITGLGPSVTTTCSVGGCPIPLTVPIGTQSGSYLLSAYDPFGHIATVTINVNVTVITNGGSIQVSTSAGVTGQIVTVTGFGFSANEQVSLSLAAPSASPYAINGTVQLYTCDANGRFTASYPMPAIAAGNYLLLALGQTSRLMTTSPFSLSAPAGAVTPVYTTPSGTVSTPASLPAVSTVQTTAYFAEGYTGTAGSNGKATFNARLVLYNPGALDSLVTTTYHAFNPATGARSTVVEQDTVAAGSTVSRLVNQDVGNDRIVSATIRADNGIVAEEVISRLSPEGTTLDGSSSLGSPRLDQAWYLAEGYVGESIQEYITLYNPGDIAATTQVRYLPSDTQAPPAQTVKVPAHGQVTINVRSAYNALVPQGSRSIGIGVTSDQPIAVDRAMYWGAGSGSGKFGYSFGPAISAGARTQYFSLLPTSDGSQSFVTVLNPNSASTSASLDLIDASGSVVKTLSAVVGASRRYTFVLPSALTNQGYLAGRLTSSTTPIVAEAGIYFGGSPNTGQHAGLLVQGSAGARIGVRAGVNPRGGTLQLFNPTGNAIRVQVTVSGASGSTVVFDASLGAKASRTLHIPAGSGSRGVLVRASDSVTGVLVSGGLGSATAWGGTIN